MFKKIISLLSFASLITLLTLIIIFFIVDLNIFGLKVKLYNSFPNFELRKIILKKDSKIEHFVNDYNVKFLPYTQFEKVNFTKKKIIFENDLISKNNNLDTSIAYKRYNSFYIDFYKDNLLLTDHIGNIYYIKKTKLFSSIKNLKAKNIKGNLNVTRVFDSFVYDDKIFVSFTSQEKDCKEINISYANINLESLEFQNFFSSNKCNKTGSPGRIQIFEKNGIKGLLVSTAEGIHDEPGINTQNKDSIFGKILFIPINEPNNIEIYSMGHRVIQGLSVNDGIVISTEHGPRGGDEINKILSNKNYGWPIASLGERYDFKYKNNNLTYKKNHSKLNFEDPIFSFIPSIGISEIIKLPSDFSTYYDNHYLLSSLNGRSLYFIRFDQNFKKAVTIEKVFINKRIRDIKYLEDNSNIILALEENGEIGIISNN